MYIFVFSVISSHRDGVEVVKIISHEKQGHFYSTQSILWLLMPW